MADSQANLDELKARRQKLAGISATEFDDQRLQTDLESLDREIARMERSLGVGSVNRVRLAATSKGV